MLLTNVTLMGMVRRIGVISLMVLAQLPLIAQQRLPPRPLEKGTSAIRGQVLDTITKAPVADCTLRAGASGAFGTRLSDLRGAYEFKDIAAGDYFFMVQCPAHLQSFCPDASRLSCPVEVARDQEREAVNFYVAPGAVARGQVMTSDGRPVTRATVRLGRGIRGEATPNAMPATTDTEGRFELTNLPAGEWRLEVAIPPAPGGLTPPIVYYPGGLSWEDAVGVELTAGEVTDRLTIVVPRINENVLTVTMPPADATASDVSVMVLQQSPLVTRRLEVNAEGTGMLKGVTPGRYVVLGQSTSNDKRWAAFEVVDFIEDNYEARLQMAPTGSIAGRIITDKGELPPLAGVLVGASWIYDGEEVNPLAFDEARVALDGSFQVDNLFGTRKLQLRGLDVGWEIAAVRQDRTDVTSSGVVVIPDAVTQATIVLRKR